MHRGAEGVGEGVYTVLVLALDWVCWNATSHTTSQILQYRDS